MFLKGETFPNQCKSTLHRSEHCRSVRVFAPLDSLAFCFVLKATFLRDDALWGLEEWWLSRVWLDLSFAQFSPIYIVHVRIYSCVCTVNETYSILLPASFKCHDQLHITLFNVSWNKPENILHAYYHDFAKIADCRNRQNCNMQLI